MMCYGLDRFSVDIDLDGVGGNIEDIVSSYCKAQGFSYRVGELPTTKACGLPVSPARLAVFRDKR